jgi:hypothetical protein
MGKSNAKPVAHCGVNSPHKAHTWSGAIMNVGRNWCPGVVLEGKHVHDWEGRTEPVLREVVIGYPIERFTEVWNGTYNCRCGQSVWLVDGLFPAIAIGSEAEEAARESEMELRGDEAQQAVIDAQLRHEQAMDEYDFHGPAPEENFWDDRTTPGAYSQQDSERDLASRREAYYAYKEVFGVFPTEAQMLRWEKGFNGFKANPVATPFEPTHPPAIEINYDNPRGDVGGIISTSTPPTPQWIERMRRLGRKNPLE